MNLETKMTIMAQMNEAREIVSKRIEEAEENLQVLEDSEPEDEESRAYEKWAEELEVAQYWLDRCYEGWEQLRKIAEYYGLEYNEGDWID